MALPPKDGDGRKNRFLSGLMAVLAWSVGEFGGIKGVPSPERVYTWLHKDQERHSKAVVGDEPCAGFEPMGFPERFSDSDWEPSSSKLKEIYPPWRKDPVFCRFTG
jgi:hypothetical protein